MAFSQHTLQRYLKIILNALCCGSGTDVKYDTATEPIEVQEALLTSPGLTKPQECDAEDSANPSFGSQHQQMLYVMRHGHRQDEADDVWHMTADRPWDPPLSQKGRGQAREAGIKMKDMNIDYVLTSPFLRCLQTSSEIVAQLGLAQGKWLVVWPMCELCDPRLLLAGREELIPRLGRRPMEQWMWGGLSTEHAIEKFIPQEKGVSDVAIKPEVWNEVKPMFPERLDQALRRYEKEIKRIAREFEGKNVLVVTHGEALRAAVNMFLPRATVYEVKHTAYVPLARERAAGKWNNWQMTTLPGQTGVMWAE